MLEVYFNIIEWGPNVYGIGEASNIIFKSWPKSKWVFISSTYYTSPRRFMYQFNDQGNLRDFAAKQDA
jgi:hypothetical protein